MDTGEKLSFGPFVVDLRERRLWRDGLPIPVTRKSFSLSAALAAQAGRLVIKTERFDIVWHGAHVSIAALSRCVHELRTALGEDAATTRFIETAHGLGFRFISTLNPVTPRSTKHTTHSSPKAPIRARRALAGRLDSLRHPADAFSQACAGRRQVVFVTGKPGIGKTALVETFITGETERARALACLCRHRDRRGGADDRAALAALPDAFDEGHDTIDLRAASTVLADIAEFSRRDLER